MKHQARKRFGQHFLTDTQVLSNLMHILGPTPAGHTLVEIGPGLGALTAVLVQHHAHVQVIEIDRDLAARLRTGPWTKQLTVHEGDVLKFDWASLPGPLRVVGNLPYNISSPILFALLPHAHAVLDQHFMLQKEMVDRMVAMPGTADYGRLSVMLQAYYTMDSVLDVPPECFDPPPKVDSAIVRMVPKPQAEREAIAGDWFSRLVAAAFAQRRKMLRNNWAGLVPPAYTEKLGINLQSRAQDLEPAQYVALAGLLAQSANGQPLNDQPLNGQPLNV